MAKDKSLNRARGFLCRFRQDKRGNTLVIMAAAMLPLLAFTGAAVDMGRLYAVKARLQQACDAGVLAGRKAMTDTTVGTPLDTTAYNQAQTFFANNFKTGWFSTSNVTFTPSKTTVGSDSSVANGVNGVASTDVPMAIMGAFGNKKQTLTITCQAVYDLADTDVMFVLDTTGSMSATPTGPNGSKATYTRSDGIQAYYSKEQTGSKIEALRQAVILFDKTMTQNKQADTKVRYGFAPYSMTVNIGKLMVAGSTNPTLPDNSALMYDTRIVSGDYDYKTNITSVYPADATACTNKRVPNAGYAGNGSLYYKVGSNSATTLASPAAYYAAFSGSTTWSSSNGGTCTGTAVIRRPLWKYGKNLLDIKDYLIGKTVATPGRVDGSTSMWRGCVEEVVVSNATSFNANSLPPDLDPDGTPTWRPLWPEAVWYPPVSPYANTVQTDGSVKDEDAKESNSYKGLSTFENGDSVTCPMEAQTLKEMTASDVNAYVYATNFKPAGNTYHDYGMSWGLRMLSTKGPFAASASAPSGRKQPAQNIVFMTDGAPVSDSDNYQMHGIEGVDKRQTGGTADEIKQHSARLRILCDAAKGRGITVYMIAFGTALTTDMKYCASPGQAFTASDNTALQDAFAAIAKRIAMLRVNK